MVQPGQAPVVVPAPAPLPPAVDKVDDRFTAYTNVIQDHEAAEARFRAAGTALQAAQAELRDADAARSQSQERCDNARDAYRDALDASSTEGTA